MIVGELVGIRYTVNYYNKHSILDVSGVIDPPLISRLEISYTYNGSVLNRSVVSSFMDQIIFFVI